ncbi:MAG: hypothetical protein M1828_003217 [Chrysothrix sp. TS-e1954]|nr:MAG: hypothetical protein M1828_003217 [Chrysothrix sp. TS-e1954]
MPLLLKPCLVRNSTRLRHGPSTHLSIVSRIITSNATFSSTGKIRSSDHQDLPSFLDYAERNGLSHTSTVFVGTRYEYVAIDALKRFGISLERVGGRDDRGIDCIGTWKHPGFAKQSTASRSGISVLMQCKALSKKIDPSVVRELEGVCSGRSYQSQEMQLKNGKSPAEDDIDDYGPEKLGSNVLGLLASPMNASQGVRTAIARSKVPLAYVKISSEHRVRQLVWNSSAASLGLEGLGVQLRYGPTANDQTGEENEPQANKEALDSEIVLTWSGKASEDVTEPG